MTHVFKVMILGVAGLMAGCTVAPPDIPPPAPSDARAVGSGMVMENPSSQGLPPGMKVTEKDLPPGTTVSVPGSFMMEGGGPFAEEDSFFYDEPF